MFMRSAIEMGGMMMLGSFGKIVLSAAVAVGSLTAATTAEARDRHRDDGDDVAIAIGAGLVGLAIGAAIADRDDHYYYDRRHYHRRHYVRFHDHPGYYYYYEGYPDRYYRDRYYDRYYGRYYRDYRPRESYRRDYYERRHYDRWEQGRRKADRWYGHKERRDYHRDHDRRWRD